MKKKFLFLGVLLMSTGVFASSGEEVERVLKTSFGEIRCCSHTSDNGLPSGTAGYMSVTVRRCAEGVTADIAKASACAHAKADADNAIKNKTTEAIISSEPE